MSIIANFEKFESKKVHTLLCLVFKAVRDDEKQSAEALLGAIIGVVENQIKRFEKEENKTHETL